MTVQDDESLNGFTPMHCCVYWKLQIPGEPGKITCLPVPFDSVLSPAVTSTLYTSIMILYRINIGADSVVGMRKRGLQWTENYEPSR